MAGDKTVRVIALSDGFIYSVLRKAGEEFKVREGDELGSVWFRPVVVGSIPQGEVEEVVKPKRGGKRKQQDAQPPADETPPDEGSSDDIG